MTDPIPSVTPPIPPRWPTPRLERIVLVTIEVAKSKPLGSASARINLLKRALRTAAEVLIPAAETMIGATGEQKKALVREQLADLLRALEKRLGLIPDFLEPLAFRAIEAALDGIIQSVYDRLRARGAV